MNTYLENIQKLNYFEYTILTIIGVDCSSFKLEQFSMHNVNKLVSRYYSLYTELSIIKKKEKLPENNKQGIIDLLSEYDNLNHSVLNNYLLKIIKFEIDEKLFNDDLFEDWDLKGESYFEIGLYLYIHHNDIYNTHNNGALTEFAEAYSNDKLLEMLKIASKLHDAYDLYSHIRTKFPLENFSSTIISENEYIFSKIYGYRNVKMDFYSEPDIGNKLLHNLIPEIRLEMVDYGEYIICGDYFIHKNSYFFDRYSFKHNTIPEKHIRDNFEILNIRKIAVSTIYNGKRKTYIEQYDPETIYCWNHNEVIYNETTNMFYYTLFRAVSEQKSIIETIFFENIENIEFLDELHVSDMKKEIKLILDNNEIIAYLIRKNKNFRCLIFHTILESNYNLPSMFMDYLEFMFWNL